MARDKAIVRDSEQICIQTIVQFDDGLVARHAVEVQDIHISHVSPIWNLRRRFVGSQNVVVEVPVTAGEQIQMPTQRFLNRTPRGKSFPMDA